MQYHTTQCCNTQVCQYFLTTLIQRSANSQIKVVKYCRLDLYESYFKVISLFHNHCAALIEVIPKVKHDHLHYIQLVVGKKCDVGKKWILTALQPKLRIQHTYF